MMNGQRLISRFLLLWVLGLLALSAIRLASWRSPAPPEPEAEIQVIRGGAWRDDFDDWRLSEAAEVELDGGRLRLKTIERLTWEQTWTAHFATGSFAYTQAISDSVRPAPLPGQGGFSPAGVYTSTAFDAGRPVDWLAADWRYSGEPAALQLTFRSGFSLPPDESWSGWHDPGIGQTFHEFYCTVVTTPPRSSCTSNLSELPSGRYFQYRAEFKNDNRGNEVALSAFTLTYGLHAAGGSAVSAPILPDNPLVWGTLNYTATLPAGTSLTVDVLTDDGGLLMPNAADGADLSPLDPDFFPAIKLRAVLETENLARTPELEAWTVTWGASNRVYFPIITRITRE